MILIKTTNSYFCLFTFIPNFNMTIFRRLSTLSRPMATIARRRQFATSSVPPSIKRRLTKSSSSPSPFLTARATTISTNTATKTTSRKLAQLGTLGVALGVGQYYLGNTNDFFEHKFITTKNPQDLADFYGTEDFMDIFCVFPFISHFMMRCAEFDDNGTIHAFGLLGPGELEVSIDFDEKEIDTNGDGNLDTIAWFNKKEHFHDIAPAMLGEFTLWEMTQNFGYHYHEEDGTCEVYHHGEKFSGLFPIRLLFHLHSKYVIWATERYIKSPSFGVEDRESDLEEQRQNIPLHVFKQFVDKLIIELEEEKTKKKKNADYGNKDDNSSTSKNIIDLEVTLQRLKSISSNSATTHDDQSNVEVKLPRLRTLRSHKTNMTRGHLIIDDEETKETIKNAMKQIGSADGNRHGPVVELSKLARHATIVSQKKEEERN